VGLHVDVQQACFAIDECHGMRLLYHYYLKGSWFSSKYSVPKIFHIYGGGFVENLYTPKKALK
jgi:hypothetical protein